MIVSRGTEVRNMARQRYCRRLARYRNTLRVSADPVAKPAAHTRAESRGSRRLIADAGERRTVCWREVDSNLRSPVSGDTPQRPRIASPGIISAKSRLALRTKGFDPFAEVLRASPESLQISEFPTGDFGSNRQAVSVETDRPFGSKAAPRCEWVLVPALANRRCVIHPTLLWPAKASTLAIIIVSNDCCGRL